MTALLKTNELDISIGNTQVCEKLSWTINAGEVWGILGLNGVGKTTLLKTLARLYKPHSGHIFIQENKLEALSNRQLAKTVGLLFQDPAHDFPQTLYEYCSTALHPQLERWQNLTDKNHASIKHALKLVGLSELHDRLISTLSGGEKRRAEIASLLIQNPAIWLLDEPLNHLDLHHQISMMKLILQYAQQKPGAVVSILHDANLALRFCSHILLLKADGQAETGTSAELLTADKLSSLYQHPVEVIESNGKTAFLAG